MQCIQNRQLAVLGLALRVCLTKHANRVAPAVHRRSLKKNAKQVIILIVAVMHSLCSGYDKCLSMRERRGRKRSEREEGRKRELELGRKHRAQRGQKYRSTGNNRTQHKQSYGGQSLVVSGAANRPGWFALGGLPKIWSTERARNEYSFMKCKNNAKTMQKQCKKMQKMQKNTKK